MVGAESNATSQLITANWLIRPLPPWSPIRRYQPVSWCWVSESQARNQEFTKGGSTSWPEEPGRGHRPRGGGGERREHHSVSKLLSYGEQHHVRYDFSYSCLPSIRLLKAGLNQKRFCKTGHFLNPKMQLFSEIFEIWSKADVF